MEELDANVTKNKNTQKNSKITKSTNKNSRIVRRGGDRKKQYMQQKCTSYVKIFSANCASLKNGKLKSLNIEVKSTGANIVTLQETHYRQKGHINMNK